ncbi:hypothetical protein ACHAPU_010973 [Fusarium lateritium]
MEKKSSQSKRPRRFDGLFKGIEAIDGRHPRDAVQPQKSSPVKSRIVRSIRQSQRSGDSYHLPPDGDDSVRNPEPDQPRSTVGKLRNAELKGKRPRSSSGSSMTQRSKRTRTYVESEDDGGDDENGVVQPAQKPRCENCSSESHTLDRCLKAPNGTIPGCPLCTATGHFLEDCEKFPMAMKEPAVLVRLLVWDRGNRPAWGTKVPWFKYLYNYTSTFEFFGEDKTFVQSAPLPWTEEYAKNVASTVKLKRLQNSSDMHGSLHSDPGTKDLAAA